MVCAKTLYNEVWAGNLSLNILELPEAIKRKKHHKNKENRKKVYRTSIDERPEIVDSRTEEGHWEGDTVVGKRNGKESVIHMANEDLSRYLWKGLDLKRYSVVRIIPQDKHNAVIIMYSNDKNDPHWCLEYMGGGHYFDTAQQLMDYYASRKFKKPFGPPL